MDRKLDRTLLEAWIKDNGPDGVSRLAVRANVSASTLHKLRAGALPRKPHTRRLIAAALGVTEDVLFPLERKKAS